MSAPFTRVPPSLSGLRLPLSCAHHVFRKVDRRSPEAATLTRWLGQASIAFGLPDDAILEDDIRHGDARRRGVTEAAWRRVAAALDLASTFEPTDDGDVVDQWIQAISVTLALGEVAAQILAVILGYKLERQMESLFDLMCECHGKDTQLSLDVGLFALLLDTSAAAVAEHLALNSLLIESGLVSVDASRRISVLPRLRSLLRRDIPPQSDLYDQLLGSADLRPLPWDSFVHLGDQADIAARILESALATRAPGINILLYGPPGTGKTSFAASLAVRAGARLRPISETDEEGDEPQRTDRLAGMRLAQRLAPSGKTILLFDEAEDLFAPPRSSLDEPATYSRVFMHQMLERNTTPIIWTANDIDALGSAVLRRMTMCVELRIPNLMTRTRLWRELGENHGLPLNEAEAGRLARLVPAAPAVAATAIRATKLSAGGFETTKTIVEGIARAVNGGAPLSPEPAPDDRFDPALIHADCDLETIEADLVGGSISLEVSFLIHGPPGSGKSAWVRHVSRLMGLPVLQKRSSDLLDPFLGGTERNIARAFQEAREERAFLVFDEADSLLLDRDRAVRSWEISQVNEMLTWMETHPFPFACTTNLIDRIDRASLRRFMVKIGFHWMTRSQARAAFTRFFGLTAPSGLDDVRMLTPADFALVWRRAMLKRESQDATALLTLLALETEGRVGSCRPVGFARDDSRT